MQKLYEQTKAKDEQIDSGMLHCDSPSAALTVWSAAILGKMQIADMFAPSEVDRVTQALKKWRVDAYKPYDENPVVKNNDA